MDSTAVGGTVRTSQVAANRAGVRPIQQGPGSYPVLGEGCGGRIQDNQRVETVATAPSFRTAFRARRCAVPAASFYEWQKVGARKQPYLIEAEDESPLNFAGLRERWDRGPELLETFAIITTQPNELLVPIHDRMLVILDPADFDAWIEPKESPIAQVLLRP